VAAGCGRGNQRYYENRADGGGHCFPPMYPRLRS
jgi:hypothetical protein